MEDIRKYRVNFQNIDMLFNSKSSGIALFDLIFSFAGAYILDKLFKISGYIHLKDPKKMYYLLVVPIGVVSHMIFTQKTFLNGELFNDKINVYKIILFLILMYIVMEIYT